jgi:hypothetical protein
VEESRICSKCKIEKPLTSEFYGPQQKNKARLHTECILCKREYMKKYQENKRLSRDPERDRMKEMATVKVYTKEEKQQRLKVAYAYLHYEAFGRPISDEELKGLEGIEE